MLGYIKKLFFETLPIRRSAVNFTSESLIFVHGLGGDAVGTWGDMLELCYSDSRINNLDIDCYEYPTSLSSIPFGPRFANIQQLSAGLATELRVRHAGAKKVIIFAHSLGGVIARHYIISEIKAGRTLPIDGLLLYAVPNTGASLALLGSMLSYKHRHLKQLCQQSDILGLINEDWERLKVEDKISVRYVVGGADKVVTPESACPYIGRDNVYTLIGSDHRSIIKPNSLEDLRYATFIDFINTRRPQSEIQLARAPQRAPDPLFETYSAADTAYYIDRQSDVFLRSAMVGGHVWVSGPSGFGKTTALRHAAFSSGLKFYHVVLGGYSQRTPIELFNAVLFELSEIHNANIDVGVTRDEASIGNEIRKILRENLALTASVILIEEIPFRTDGDYMSFLTIMLRFCQSLDIDSVLQGRIQISFASIKAPDDVLRGEQAKIREKIQLLHFDVWSTVDIVRLVNLLTPLYHPNLGVEDKEKIVIAAKGSPRFVKALFRKWRNGFAFEKNIDEVLGSIKTEMV